MVKAILLTPHKFKTVRKFLLWLKNKKNTCKAAKLEGSKSLILEEIVIAKCKLNRYRKTNQNLPAKI